MKGSNLLTGFGPGRSHEVYLVDYGLAYRYNPDGKHKDYKEDPRKAHDGTIEFTSIDAHKGVSKSCTDWVMSSLFAMNNYTFDQVASLCFFLLW